MLRAWKLALRNGRSLWVTNRSGRKPGYAPPPDFFDTLLEARAPKRPVTLVAEGQPPNFFDSLWEARGPKRPVTLVAVRPSESKPLFSVAGSREHGTYAAQALPDTLQ
jgi:hypothetical protein